MYKMSASMWKLFLRKKLKYIFKNVKIYTFYLQLVFTYRKRYLLN